MNRTTRNRPQPGPELVSKTKFLGKISCFDDVVFDLSKNIKIPTLHTGFFQRFIAAAAAPRLLGNLGLVVKGVIVQWK